MSTNAISDLPPAYTTLHESTLDIAAVEEDVQKCNDKDELLVSDSFEDKKVRLGFILKVLTIKLLQLIGVAVFMILFNIDFSPDLRWFMDWNYVHIVVWSLWAFICTLVMMVWCDEARRKRPYKFMFLVVLPLTFTAFISSATFWNVLLEFTVAWINHCVVVFALLVYINFEMHTKLKFTILHIIFFAIGVQLILFAMTVPIMYSTSRADRNGFYVLYPTIILILEEIYLLFDLQVMTSKGYRTIITPDDYVDAALQQHIDYIYIFMKYLVPKIRSSCDKCIH